MKTKKQPVTIESIITLVEYINQDLKFNIQGERSSLDILLVDAETLVKQIKQLAKESK